MFSEKLLSIQNTIFDSCENFTRKKNWLFILVVTLPLVVLFFSFPSYDRLNNEFSENWQAIFKQAAGPLTDHQYNPDSHQAKLTFRLTVPLIIRTFHLNLAGVLIFQALIGMLLFYFAAKLFHRETNDKVSALLLSFSLAFIYAGRVSFNEIRGIFDGLALFFMVWSMYFRNPFLIFTGVFLAAWTDERALIASCLVFLYWIYWHKNNSGDWKILNSGSVAVFLAWIFYFAFDIT